MCGAAVSALRWLDARFRAPAPAARLAMVRILVGAFAVIYCGARLPMLVALAHHDPRGFVPVGACSLLAAAPSPTVSVALAGLTALLALPFTLGFGHRWLAPLFAACLFFTTSFASSWGMLYHADNLLLFHVIILALVPAADAWSLDSRHRAAPPPHADYGWPLRLMAFIAALTYFLAGMAKLRGSGLHWALDALLRHHVAFDNVRKVELGTSAAPLGPASLSVSWLWPILAWCTLTIELGAPVFVLLGRGWARAWSVAMVLFHWGILFMMGITFAYPLMGVAFACMWRCERLGELVLHRYRRLTARLDRPRSR
jgi:hypothetical protein